MKTRRVSAIALLLATQAGLASAALAPQFQNPKDLDAMVAFVKKHARVVATLKSIDLRHYVVHYDTNCRAEFERERIERPAGWVGPQAPLVFARSNCPLD